MIRCSGRILSLQEIMKEFNFASFLGLSQLIQGLIAPMGRAALGLPDTEIEAEVRTSGREALILYRPQCVELGLTLSTMTIDDIVRVLDNPTSTYASYLPLLTELHRRLQHEALVAIRFFQISVREAEFYNMWWDGWKEVLSRFPDTTSDVEEASKCFALARYAASVYHSTQIIEIGLLALGQFIGVNDPKSGYTAVTNELKRSLNKKYTELTDFERANRAFLEQVHVTTEAIKNAWRNKIDHAQGRLVLLREDFTPEIAEEILMATRAFMRRLATEMPS